MTLTALGWLVIHSLWLGTAIAGLTAMALGWLHRARASTRYAAAIAGLMLMVLAPVLTLPGPGFRSTQVLRLSPPEISQVISYPTFIWWGSVIVPVVGAIWMIGCGASIVRLAWEARRAHVLRSHDTALAGRETHTTFDELRRMLAPAATVDLRASSLVLVPMVIGWRRPRVLLPVTVASRLTPAQLRGIVAHELAHVRRGDYATNLLQVLADAMLWHHPAARWLSRRVRTEREYCCDDVAVSVNQDALEYGRALAILEDARAETRLAVAAVSGTLLDRVERMLGRPRRVLTPIRGALIAIAALVLAAPVLVVAMSLPRALPWATVIRQRMPAPTGAVMPGRGGPPAPSAERRLRTP